MTAQLVRESSSVGHLAALKVCNGSERMSDIHLSPQGPLFKKI